MVSGIQVTDLPIGTTIDYPAAGVSVTKQVARHDPWPWKGDGLEVGDDWVRLALADGAQVLRVGDGSGQ